MIEQNGKRWYKPSEIAKRELIKNSVGKGDYRFVLRLIKGGQLKAETWNVSGEKPYFVVSQDEIDSFNEARFGAR
jgi:hypothetical protein